MGELSEFCANNSLLLNLLVDRFDRASANSRDRPKRSGRSAENEFVIYVSAVAG